jgi:glycosyltransferase involved in cell wall biosynthesis
MKSVHSIERARRPRILFIPQWYPNAENHQRSGVFCREHVRAAGLYDDVAVLVYTSRSQRWPTLHWERAYDLGRPLFYGTYGRSFIPWTTRHFFYIHLKRAIRRVIREWFRPDVIHTQDAYAYPVIKAAEDLNIPFVISQHWGGVMRRELDTKAVHQFQWAFERAARVLPSNKFAASDYDYYGLEAQTTWLPNTLDTRLFYPAPINVKKPCLLHASGFTAEKRFPDIVRAFARVCVERPGATLQVVGDGPNRRSMESLASRELPPASFKFHGFIHKPALAALMRSARGFVLASEAETFGCVLMEAMACGCPVLTTRVGGIPAVVPEDQGLFFEVGNIDQMAHGMVSLLDGTHGLDMNRISEETRKRFSYETVGRILHDEHIGAARMTNGNAANI